jgi:hypothetical protein
MTKAKYPLGRFLEYQSVHIANVYYTAPPGEPNDQANAVVRNTHFDGLTLLLPSKLLLTVACERLMSTLTGIAMCIYFMS